MTDRIKLIPPSAEYERAVLDFRQEFFDAGEQTISGSSLLDKTPHYADWLAQVRANARRETLIPGWVLTEVFLAIRERDGAIVGIIDLRHELNDFLRDFGHCGYSVRPGERGKGYATAMLQQVCAHAHMCGMEQLQLSCELSNTPSLRIITRAGGEFLRHFTHAGEQAAVYMLSCSPRS